MRQNARWPQGGGDFSQGTELVLFPESATQKEGDGVKFIRRFSNDMSNEGGGKGRPAKPISVLITLKSTADS